MTRSPLDMLHTPSSLVMAEALRRDYESSHWPFQDHKMAHLRTVIFSHAIMTCTNSLARCCLASMTPGVTFERIVTLDLAWKTRAIMSLLPPHHALDDAPLGVVPLSLARDDKEVVIFSMQHRVMASDALL